MLYWLALPRLANWQRSGCAWGSVDDAHAPRPHQHHLVHMLWQGIATWAGGTEGNLAASTLRGPAAPGMHPEQCQRLAGVLCWARCAQAGEHVAARLRSETRTRHIIETGISCHRKSLTYLCHFNALHSEPGLKKPNTLPAGFSEII